MKTKLVIVVSGFNDEITSVMEKAAEKAAKNHGAEIIKKVYVPGAFEIPFAVKNILEKGKADAIVALGAVIQGSTYHDILIMDAIVPKLMDLSLQYKKPVGMGIIGPRVTWKQAEERAEEYAERAVKAALEMVKLTKK
ncbi:6,7-dimethyl-8-ribityllumazine synthase [Candidatus Woesearchaeota archaeon]|nr:6,7-dimethyl-8-ribityllumazine synthase [Candidatus Woesearchaeota archaeon]